MKNGSPLADLYGSNRIAFDDSGYYAYLILNRIESLTESEALLFKVKITTSQFGDIDELKIFSGGPDTRFRDIIVF